MTPLSDRVIADVVAAMDLLPETVWLHGDDACDCTFQRIGLWKNPYIGETLEVRMCCIWGELYKLFPQHVRSTPAYLDGEDEWRAGQAEWNGETEMPRALWYRQLARHTGKPLADVRSEYGALTPPQGTPRPAPEAEDGIDPLVLLFSMIGDLADELAELKESLRAG